MISFFKIPLILLILVLFPLVANAGNNGAPTKFYDGLQSKARQLAQQHQAKEMESESTTVNIRQKKSPRNTESTASTKKAVPVQTHVVEKHQSLATIATHFNVSIEQLTAWNAITSTDQLSAGQKLKIFKNKQKHSISNLAKNPAEILENVRDNAQKTSIISINNKSMLKFYCHWPTTGKIIKKFSQTGGRGIEIRGERGQAIKAAAAGKVVAVSPGIYGHGGFIVIQHHGRFLSSYANNQRSLVKNGQQVSQGQIIAEMGQVGRKPPSLEFQIRKNAVLLDPMWFLPKNR